MSDIHTRIKKLRTDLGLSMEALASLVGVKWQTVQQWEKQGGTAPKRDRLSKVADALKTSAIYLLEGKHADTHAPSTALRVEQPVAKHSPRPLVNTLCELAEQIDDNGLRELVGFARCLTGTHPLTKTKAA